MSLACFCTPARHANTPIPPRNPPPIDSAVLASCCTCSSCAKVQNGTNLDQRCLVRRRKYQVLLLWHLLGTARAHPRFQIPKHLRLSPQLHQARAFRRLRRPAFCGISGIKPFLFKDGWTIELKKFVPLAAHLAELFEGLGCQALHHYALGDAISVRWCRCPSGG